MDIIRAQKLSQWFYYGDETIQILDDLDFSLQAGVSAAITGVSGSGKSTLLSLLAGLEMPKSGHIYWEDTDITQLAEDEITEKRLRFLSFIFQDFQLLPNLTAFENIALPLEIKRDPDAEAKAHEWLVKVGLDKRGRHYPNHLSGGEQQRVAIARAFASAPRVLLADEPTGNLDKQTAIRVMELLFDLQASMNMTLVIVTHDEGLAADCKQCYELKAGKL